VHLTYGLISVIYHAVYDSWSEFAAPIADGRNETVEIMTLKLCRENCRLFSSGHGVNSCCKSTWVGILGKLLVMSSQNQFL